MRIVFLALCLLLPLCAATTSLSREPLLIGLPCYNKGCSLEELENILSEAYARIGEAVYFRYLPPKRMTEEASGQRIDGYGLITMAEAQSISGLTIVPEPLGQVALVAFSAYKGRKISTWEDLRGLTVGTVRGSILVQDESLEGLDIRRHVFNDAASAFPMLKEGRLDAILGGASAGTLLAHEMGVEVFLSEPLKTVPLYHAVADRHADFAPRLAEAFRSMAEDGTLLRLFGRFKNMVPEK